MRVRLQALVDVRAGVRVCACVRACVRACMRVYYYACMISILY